MKNITDNKKFWQTVKPFLSDKSTSQSLVLDNQIISEDNDVAEALNSFFKNDVASLDLNINNFILSDISDLENPIEIAITKFARHPSILAIKNNVATKDRKNIIREIALLDPNKSVNLDPFHRKCFANILIFVLKTS